MADTTDNLYKKLEPDANEVMFGQKTLPNRPLTVKEASKRKKILLKLVDQELKFKLIELMRHQVVAGGHNRHADKEPTVRQTIDNFYPSHSFNSGSYQSQPNSLPYSAGQYTEANWQQYHYQGQWQSSNYPQQYGAAVNVSWNNNRSFQPPNIHHFHQNSKPKKSHKQWKFTQNPNLICPMTVNATNKISHVIHKEDTKISTKTSVVGVQEQPNETVSAPGSSLILVRAKG